MPSLGALRQMPVLISSAVILPQFGLVTPSPTQVKTQSGTCHSSMEGTGTSRAWDPWITRAATCRDWLPPKVVLKMLLCPLFATHTAWGHAALVPPSHCTLWSLVLGDIHPGMLLTWPHVMAQSLHGSLCAAPVLASLESTVRGSVDWQH